MKITSDVLIDDNENKNEQNEDKKDELLNYSQKQDKPSLKNLLLDNSDLLLDEPILENN